MVDFSYWTAYSLVTTLVRVNGHAIYCHKGEKLKTVLRQNFGRTIKSIVVFLKKRPIAIEQKTYTALHATSMANHTAGFPDERRRIYFTEPTRQKMESSTDLTLLDWLLEDAMVAFCYCCSRNIDAHFKKEKMIIIIIIVIIILLLLLSLLLLLLLLLIIIIVTSKGRHSLAFRIQFDTYIYIFIGSRVG